MKKKLWQVSALVLSSLLFAGCATTITNLTPSTERRNPSGLYPFEVTLDTGQQSIRKDTLTPFVLIGSQAYAMQPTLGLKNRWETLVPIPADKEYVNYQFKFNYLYNAIPRPRPGSKLSPPYRLQIVEK